MFSISVSELQTQIRLARAQVPAQSARVHLFQALELASIDGVVQASSASHRAYRKPASWPGLLMSHNTRFLNYCLVLGRDNQISNYGAGLLAKGISSVTGLVRLSLRSHCLDSDLSCNVKLFVNPIQIAIS